VAVRELGLARSPRLLEVGKGLVEDANALLPLGVFAGRVQAREVAVTDEGDHQAGFCTTWSAMPPSTKMLVPVT
jgi:hypothetical protein